MRKKLIQTIVQVMLVFLAVAIVLMFTAWFFLSQYVWMDGTIYRFLHFINDNKVLVLLLLCVLCAAVLWARSWRQMMGYLNETVEAAKLAARTDDQPIVLSKELKEVEYLMNQIKANVKANEQAAREAEQRKKDWMVYLAHDLKTPLTSVIGYLNLLMDDVQSEPRLPAALQEKYLSIALVKAERLEDLIHEFFEITKYQVATLLEYSTVNLTRMLEQICFEFQPMLQPKHLTIRLDAPPDLQLYCDADKIQRVFDNLLRNAVNYCYEDSEILIRIREDAQSVQLQFTNHGATIPEEKLTRIFEQFYRLDDARMTRTGGSGLGLSIAKEIVELHRGTIRAYRKEEQIRFVVYLPKHTTSDGETAFQGIELQETTQ